MKNKLFNLFVLPTSLLVGSAPIITTVTSCNKTKSLENLLKNMPRVEKVEKLDDMPGFTERYIVWFKHQIDWNDESKGYFLQRVEVNFRGYDRVNQLFTCGYELRSFNPKKMNDFEIGNRYMGNIIKPEYRFFDKSRPDGLNNEKLDGWEYLTNAQAMEDFHYMIESFKTIFSGKWVFSGTSKGGETTNCFAMTHPNDCDVYVPYVAPRFYDRGNKELQEFVNGIVGNDIFGEKLATEYKTEIAKLQWFAIQNRKLQLSSDANDNLIERVWKSGEDSKFTDYANAHHEYIFYICVLEYATAFWQYNEDIGALRAVTDMPETSNEEKIAKAIKCAQLLIDVAGITGYAIDGLFFPYESQAAREMGEYDYSGDQMIDSISRLLGIDKTTVEAEANAMVPKTIRQSNEHYWKCNLTEEQYDAWIKLAPQDMTMANKLKEWNNTCTVPVIMVFGGSDPWYSIRLSDQGTAPGIKRYVGKDSCNAAGRTHMTRISTLSVDDQNKIWKQLDEILK